MQSFSEVDLRRIVPRVSEKVDLRGVKTSAEINKRLLAKINEFPPTLSPGWSAFLKNLIPWFGTRVIDAARANPHGEVALTLKHGRKVARMIIEEQTRKRIEYLRKNEEPKYRRKKYRRKK